jgi:hypothetical protein
VPSFVRPFVGRTLHKTGAVLGAQVSAEEQLDLFTGALDIHHIGETRHHIGVVPVDASAVLAWFKGWVHPTLIRFVIGHGFVAQIVLKTFLPLPQTDSAYGFCLGYAKSGEAI